MSDAESIAENAAYEAAMQAEETETFRVMVLENLENDAYWAKEERDQFEQNTQVLKQKRDMLLEVIAELQVEIEKRDDVTARREGELHNDNEKRKVTSDKLQAEIVDYLRPFAEEGLKPKVFFGDVKAAFGVGDSKIWAAWKIAKKK